MAASIEQVGRGEGRAVIADDVAGLIPAGLDAAVGHWLESARPTPGTVYDAALAAFERPLFAEVLRESGGNQLRAAQRLGINRNPLRKRLGELDIDPDAFVRRA